MKTLQAAMQESSDHLLIIDVRTADKYQAGHIPGAINLPSEDTFSRRDKTRILSLNDLRVMFSQLGITNDDHVFLYDNGLLRDAAHVFWTMEVYGHAHVSVLEGGLPGWLKFGGELSRGIEKRPASTYVPSMSPHHLATKLTTRLAIENDSVLILDSRAPVEYRGKKSKAKRYGHITGAVNIPADLNMEQRGGVSRVKSKQQLQSLYAALGKQAQVITYCNRGRDSAMSYLILRNLGYPVAVYDGAWLEWGNDDQLPITNPQSGKRP